MASPAAQLNLSNYKTILDDNFSNDTALNSGLWPVAWGNADDFSFANGMLTLTSYASEGWSNVGFMQGDFGTGSGQGYGLYSVTASLNANEGLGVCICLWPSDNTWPGPELDILESWDATRQTGYATIHWAGSDGSNQYDAHEIQVDLTRKNTFSLDWQPGSLTYYINGTEVFATTANVPKDAADGGTNESFGAEVTAAGYAPVSSSVSLHLYDMSIATRNAGTTVADVVSVAKPASLVTGTTIAVTGTESDPTQAVWLDWSNAGVPAATAAGWVQAAVGSDGAFSASVVVGTSTVASTMYYRVGSTGAAQIAWTATPTAPATVAPLTVSAAVVNGELDLTGTKHSGSNWTMRWLLDGAYQGTVADNEPDGAWTFDTAAPAAGTHTVTVYLDSTNTTATTTVTVAAATPVTPAASTAPLTVAVTVLNGQLDLSGTKDTGSDWTVRWSLDGAYQGTVADNEPDGAWNFGTALPAPGQHSVMVFLDSTNASATTTFTVNAAGTGLTSASNPSVIASDSVGNGSGATSQMLWTAPGTDILVNGTGGDIDLVNCSSPDGWASIRNFSGGDTLALLGLDWNVGRATWVNGVDGQGKAGATLDVDLRGTGHVDAAVTLVGVSLATVQIFSMSSGSMNGEIFLAVHG